MMHLLWSKKDMSDLRHRDLPESLPILSQNGRSLLRVRKWAPLFVLLDADGAIHIKRFWMLALVEELLKNIDQNRPRSERCGTG